MHNLAEQAHPAFPVTIYYAFKQAKPKVRLGTHSTGWETFLEAVFKAGFALTGTWPMRTELGNRMIGPAPMRLRPASSSSAASAPPMPPPLAAASFSANSTPPAEALLDMTRGGVNSPVAPVDLSQAIIGPGMAIFSQYAPCWKPTASR
jgi:putative DNA methylase